MIGVAAAVVGVAAAVVDVAAAVVGIAAAAVGVAVNKSGCSSLASVWGSYFDTHLNQRKVKEFRVRAS